MAAEKSQSWVYDGPIPVNINGKYTLKYPDEQKYPDELNDNVNMEMDENEKQEKESMEEGRTTDWSEAKKGPITRKLVLCTLIVTVASSIQFGYNAGCTVGAAPIGDLYRVGGKLESRTMVLAGMSLWFMKTFINETQFARNGLGLTFPPAVVDLLWTFAEAGFRFGAAMGSQAGGQIANRIGRRNGLLIQNTLAVFSSLMLGFTTLIGSWELLLFGRLFIGFGTGISMTIIPLYLSEISPTNKRGAVGSVHYLMVAVGLLISQGINFFPLNSEELWPLSLSLGGVFALFGLLTIPYCPETPRHLAIAKGKYDEAEEVLQDLRGNRYDIKAEMEEIKHESGVEKKRGVDGFVDTICCRAPGWKKPVYLALLLQVTQQLAVITAFTFNSLETWRGTDINEESLFFAIVGSDALIVLAAILPICISDSFGRKRMLMFGYYFSLISLVSLTVFLSLNQTSEDNWPLLGSLLSIFVFLIAFSSGPGSLPYVIIPEMFTHQPRAFILAMSNQIFWFSSLVISFLYPALLDMIGPYTFIVFIVCLIPPIIILQIYLPEGKQNTYVENTALFLPATNCPKRINSSAELAENEVTNDTV